MSTQAAGARARGCEIERLASLVRSVGSVVALTGAGISVPSGIPDFRSPGSGLWEGVDPFEVAHADVLRRDPRRFWSFYGPRLEALQSKRPNAAHRALVTLERAQMLAAVITQNIDTLHAKAGTRELVEVHGSIERCQCTACRAEVALGELHALLGQAPDGVPRCPLCAHPLRPGIVLFGDLLPAPALERAQRLCAAASVLLCIGSSLEVFPVAALPRLTHASGGAVAIVTRGPTPLDGIAQVRLSGDVVQELGALLGALELARPPDPARALSPSELLRLRARR